MDQTFIGILTGTDPTGRGDPTREMLKRAVADRFAVIRDTLVQKQGDYVYSGNRCHAEELGWRFIQSHGMIDAQEIRDGKHDEKVTATWHEAASAEHWYMYEKDWGYGPGMGAFGYDE